MTTTVNSRDVATVPGTLWWDFDGTLVSRPFMWSEAAHRLLSERSPDTRVTVEDLRPLFRNRFAWEASAHPELDTPDQWWRSSYDSFRAVFAEIRAPDLEETFDTLRQDIVRPDGYVVFDDVVPVLSALSDAGWRHIVVSNHVPELPEIVEGLGLGRFFDAVLTSGIIGYEKPHPKMFDAAKAATKSIGPVWMIGDSPQADCAGATACGVNAVLVRTTEGFHRQSDDLWGVLRMLAGVERAGEC